LPFSEKVNRVPKYFNLRFKLSSYFFQKFYIFIEDKNKNDILSVCLFFYTNNITVAILAQVCCGSIPHL